MKKINEIFTNTSYDWVNIKESINSYCYNFVFSLFFVKNAEKYILIDDYLLLKINYFLWKQWENIGCKNNSALLLGLDEKERKTVVNTKVIYWGKEHYDIVKNYLNKDYIKNEGVLFFNTTHQEAIKRHSVKAALKESFLL